MRVNKNAVKQKKMSLDKSQFSISDDTKKKLAKMSEAKIEATKHSAKIVEAAIPLVKDIDDKNWVGVATNGVKIIPAAAGYLGAEAQYHKAGFEALKEVKKDTKGLDAKSKAYVIGQYAKTGGSVGLDVLNGAVAGNEEAIKNKVNQLGTGIRDVGRTVSANSARNAQGEVIIDGEWREVSNDSYDSKVARADALASRAALPDNSAEMSK